MPLDTYRLLFHLKFLLIFLIGSLEDSEIVHSINEAPKAMKNLSSRSVKKTIFFSALEISVSKLNLPLFNTFNISCSSLRDLLLKKKKETV